MKNERLFSRKDNPMDIRQTSEIVGELLSEPAHDVAILNGHSRLEIPSETFKKIEGLDPEKQQRIGGMLSHALQDANEVKVEERKFPEWFYHYFPKSS
ncbi:MAG: hypothetical protein U1E54_02055 [Candidatus Levybacteria bacterium]|nr:hypothetical protein [Candidatus Levybacteria bacterium]